MAILEAAILRQPRLSRFICHVYQRLSTKRLNLVTGAGISIDAGVPSWDKLLDRLAEGHNNLKTDFEIHRKAGLNPEYLGQIIYHRLRNDCSKAASPDLQEATINHEWATQIYKAIYESVPDDIHDVVKKHPYLKELAILATKAPLVINFNFDDLFSDAMNSGLNESRRSSSVVWHPPLIERSDTTTIYHVNGLLPRVSLKKRSPQLIFTEDSFADALARAPGVSSEYIFLRFVQNTMLIIGHSLNDTSLKNYLRKNRDKCPANHHYVVHWISSDDSLSDQQRTDIFQANLELYNLITIFLTSGEIKEFVSVLNQSEREFRETLDNMGSERRHQYHYYITGPVAAGKSSILEQLRCFQTYEEWTRPPPKEMYLAFDKLDEKDQENIDAFVYSELKEKNRYMQEAKAGFHFMDRAPLDLYAFSKSDSERHKKTEELRNLVTRDRQLHPGEIIFVTAKGETLVKRNTARGRIPKDSGEVEYLNDQEEYLKSIYEPIVVISTDEKTQEEAAKEVARHALLGEYNPTDLMSKMDQFDE